jgi:hypothetical protein
VELGLKETRSVLAPGEEDASPRHICGLFTAKSIESADTPSRAKKEEARKGEEKDIVV